MTKVFISFRNGDEPYAAALLYEALVRRLGAGQVFRSSDSIPPGAEWAEMIWEHHRRSQVVIVVIGPRWLSIRDRTGRRKLWQPHDWVRKEVAGALTDGKHVVPVLAGTPRLDEPDLPDSIAGLAARQSVAMDHRDLRTGVPKVLDAVARHLGIPARSPTTGFAGSPTTGPAGSPTTGPAGSHDKGGWLRVWNLPARIPGFVERESLMGALRDDVLRAGGERPVLLHGGIGAGKTQLAAEYAYRFAGDHHLAWWVPVTRPELLWSQLAGLGRELGFDPETGVAEMVPLLARELHRRGRWLLVLDGVQDPAWVTGPLAAIGPGADVLITSRNADWGMLVAARRPVGTFDRGQSVSLLGGHLPSAAAPQLADLAAAVDDIPLALAQAATFLTSSAVTLEQYLDLLRTRSLELLERGETYVYPTSLAAAWSVGLGEVREASADAGALLDVLSVLAPAPVPLDRLGSRPVGPTGALAGLADPIRRADAVDAVDRSGLVPVVDGRPRPHGLFQAYLRTGVAEPELAVLREAAGRLLAVVTRPDPREPAAWDAYAVLLPHVLTLDLAAVPDPGCHELLLDVAHHLVVRGDAAAARDLVRPAATRWRERHGPDAPSTLGALARLAQASFRLRDFQAALSLDEEVLAHRRRLAGDDDPRTLEAAHDVAITRFALQGAGPVAARLADVVARRTRVLGADHPDTLRSVQNLALVRRAGGDLAGARELDQDTWHRLREVLGEDHPDTLRSAYALALDLRALGHPDRSLGEDTYRRRRRVLGDDHPDTLRSAYGLAVDLLATGARERAGELARQAYRRQLRLLGDGHVDTLRSAYLLAEATHADDPDAARRLRQEVAAKFGRPSRPPR